VGLYKLTHGLKAPGFKPLFSNSPCTSWRTLTSTRLDWPPRAARHGPPAPAHGRAYHGTYCSQQFVNSTHFGCKDLNCFVCFVHLHCYHWKKQASTVSDGVDDCVST
jgi:hypothetical protein